jgi:hypothetical protein
MIEFKIISKNKLNNSWKKSKLNKFPFIQQIRLTHPYMIIKFGKLID